MSAAEADTTKTRILNAIERIENRLEQFKDVPREVEQLRALNNQLHEALKVRQDQDSIWRGAMYRILKESISLLFPERRKP